MSFSDCHRRLHIGQSHALIITNRSQHPDSSILDIIIKISGNKYAHTHTKTHTHKHTRTPTHQHTDLSENHLDRHLVINHHKVKHQ